MLEPYASAVLIKTKTTKAAAKNAAPTVSITNPVANARFTAPASIKISAAATDKDGTISKVEFYNGSQLLETKYSAPYTFTRNNVKEGKYTLTAKATDNSGNAATSAGVSISVGSKKAPTVRLINPDNNRVYKGAANIYIRALANSSTGRIKKVDFYSNNRLLGTQNLYPFVISWKNVPPGTYTLKAIATDNNNLSTTSAPVKVTVAAKSKSRVSSRPSSQTSITAPDSALDKLDLSDNTASLKVSPNPVSTTLNIAIKGLEQNKELTISVVSVSGNTVKTIRSNTSGQVVQMDVSSLNNGVYIIKVVCGNKVLSQQFVKL